MLKPKIIAKSIFVNQRTRFRAWKGDTRSVIGSTHRHLTTAQSLAYIERLLNDYLTQGGLSTADLAGVRVLEIGHGDNAGLALRLLALGAREVVCLDKFFSERDSRQQYQIYAALREQLPEAQRPAYDAAIQLTDQNFSFDAGHLRWMEGCGLEEAPARLGSGVFDLILSRAVLEEIPDLDQAFAAMQALLRPGGRMIHKVDLSDYGIFSRQGFSPFEFLTIPELLYRQMSSHSGKPNRRRLSHYRALCERYGYRTRFHHTCLLGGQGELPVYVEHPEYPPELRRRLRDIRPRLASPFRDIAEEDLLSGGFFLITQKPPLAG